MIISIDLNDARPIYQQIVDEVRRAVVVGTLEAGAALPSVRQLAASLRVNPNTVQQAYRELEREGLAYARRGQGTYVTELAGGLRRAQRQAVAESVARRAVLDARRHGLSVEGLVEAIQESIARAGGES